MTNPVYEQIQTRFWIPPEIVALILRIREERRYGAVRKTPEPLSRG